MWCLRPWPNDQTLLVQCFNFAFQKMIDRLATSKNIAWQAKVTKFVALCSRKAKQKIWTNNVFGRGQTDKHLLDKWMWNTGPTIFDHLASQAKRSNVFGKHQTVMFSDVVKSGVKHFAWHKQIPMFANNVWSFGQDLTKTEENVLNFGEYELMKPIFAVSHACLIMHLSNFRFPCNFVWHCLHKWLNFT